MNRFIHVDPALQRFEIVSRDTDQGRIYTTPDGTEYWSMTTMLGMTSDKSWLENWVKSLGEENAKIEVERCCIRGEAVHLASEYYINNKPLELCIQTTDKYRRLFNQIRRTLDTNITKVYATELPVYSNMLKVGGRLDLMAEWRGELAIIDYKGSTSLKTRGQIEDYSHQLCGYSLAVEELYGLKAKKLVNIIANEKSLTPTIITFDRKDLFSGLSNRIKQFHEMISSPK